MMAKKNKATEVASGGTGPDQKDKSLTIGLVIKPIRIILKQVNKAIQDKEHEVIQENNFQSLFLTLLDLLKIERVFKIGKEKSLALEALQIVESISLVVKNLLTIEECRKKLSNPAEMNNLLGWIKLIDKFMEFFENNKEEEGTMEKGETCVTIIVNFICCIRNIEALSENTMLTLETECLNILTQVLKRNFAIKEIVLNIVRILSKQSLSAAACEKMSNTENLLETLLEQIDVYKESNAIIMRVAFVLANITTFNDALRNYIYFKLDGFNASFSAFEHYINKVNFFSYKKDNKSR